MHAHLLRADGFSRAGLCVMGRWGACGMRSWVSEHIPKSAAYHVNLHHDFTILSSIEFSRLSSLEFTVVTVSLLSLCCHCVTASACVSASPTGTWPDAVLQALGPSLMHHPPYTCGVLVSLQLQHGWLCKDKKRQP